MIDSIGHDGKIELINGMPLNLKKYKYLIVCINYYYIISFLGFDEFKDALVEFIKSSRKSKSH